jgi:nitroreductase
MTRRCGGLHCWQRIVDGRYDQARALNVAFSNDAVGSICEDDDRSLPQPAFRPDNFHRLPPDEQDRRVGEFLDRVRTRRSVRDFSDEPVPLALIERAIEAAASAPSGANKQPWRFVVVSDAQVKRRIRQAAEAEEKENYSRRFPQDWLDDLEPFGTDWRKPFLETAPYLIVVFRIDYGLRADGGKSKHYYVNESVGIACGFLLAALTWAGLATLTHTPSPMKFLGEILDRPPNERPFLLIPVGYPAPGALVPDIEKKSLSEVMLLDPA